MNNCLLLCAVACYSFVKAFFGYSEDKPDKLIKFADAPTGAHTEETCEDTEEAELDEAWDLNAASKCSRSPR
jgi:hypothetical protein